MVSELRINLNDIVKFKLTETGQKYRDARLPSDSSLLKPKDDGYIHEQLWFVMQFFGPMIYMGMPKVPFVGCEFIVKGTAV